MTVTIENRVDDEVEGRVRAEQRAAMVSASILPRLFDRHPLFTIVLDPDRRIVYANATALGTARVASAEYLIGKRLGEALGCVHATANLAGCGSSESCCFCGANKGLKAALRKLEEGPIPDSSTFPGLGPKVEAEECSILRRADRDGSGHSQNAIDLRIWSEAFNLEGQGFVILTAADISADKRREVLERVFYHDIANTANGIRTILELLGNLDGESPERYKVLLRSAADQLVEEIESQRALKAAESRDLEARFEILEARSLLESTLAIFTYKLEGKDIRLELAPGTPWVAVESDPVLLRRVLVNMLKNAIEAAVRGEILLAGIHIEAGRSPLDPNGESGGEGHAVIWVRNSAVMPEVARRRVFHRSFSTKGRGRGFGTYSMRLLAESYLRGRVSFSSREGEGTVFELRIPLA